MNKGLMQIKKTAEEAVEAKRNVEEKFVELAREHCELNRQDSGESDILPDDDSNMIFLKNQLLKKVEY